MKVKGNDGETACNALSSCWQTTQLSGCADHDGCWHSRMFHAQMSISIVKMQPGGSSPTELFPCLVLPCILFPKGQCKKPNFFLMSLMYFFQFMNPQISRSCTTARFHVSRALSHTAITASTLPVLRSLTLTPDIPVPNVLCFGLPQELRKKRAHHHPKHKLLQPY